MTGQMDDLRRLDPGWRRFVEWEVTTIQCSTCLYYDLGAYKVCAAYPKGIPNDVFLGGGCEKYEPRDPD